MHDLCFWHQIDSNTVSRDSHFLKPVSMTIAVLPGTFGTRAPGTMLDAKTQRTLAQRRKPKRGARTGVPPTL